MKLEVPVDVVSALSKCEPQFLVRDVERSPWSQGLECSEYMEPRELVPKMGVRSFEPPFVRPEPGVDGGASSVLAKMASDNRNLMAMKWNSIWGREARQARKISGSSSASSIP